MFRLYMLYVCIGQDSQYNNCIASEFVVDSCHSDDLRARNGEIDVGVSVIWEISSTKTEGECHYNVL